MLPTISDLNKGIAPANDIAEDWMKSSEDAQKISVLYRKLANDQSNAYEKTLDRIMSVHNGHNARYRNPETGKFITQKSAAANDRVDRYERTLDRIMNMHNDHENARGPGDSDNDNRTIHDFNPEIPQSMTRLMPKYVSKKDRPVGKEESEAIGGDKSEIDLLRSIDNTETNILDVLHRISYTLDDSHDADSLRAREKELSTGHVINQESLQGILAGLSGAKKDGKDTQEKDKGGLLDNILGLGKDAGWALGLAGGGLLGTFLSKVLGSETPIESGGGHTGIGQKPQNRADSPHRQGGRVPTENTIPSSKPDVIGGKPSHGLIPGAGVGYVAATAIPTPVKGDGAFQSEVTRLARKYHMAEDDLYRIMSYETGGSFSPGQRNAAGSSGTGLIQFMRPTAKALGTSVEALSGMSRSEQMKYVEKYLDSVHLGKVKNPSLLDAYLEVYKPKAVGKGPNYVHAIAGTKEYKQNRGFDVNHDGIVQSWEIANRLYSHKVPGVGMYNTPSKTNYSDLLKLNDADSENRKVIKALKNVKAGQQVRFNNGATAGVGSVTVKLPPSQPPVHHTTVHNHPAEKRRPPPARSSWWDEWKPYFGL